MNDLSTNKGEINRNGCVFNINKDAMQKIKSASDEVFEREISSMDDDMKAFMRIMRKH